VRSDTATLNMAVTKPITDIPTRRVITIPTILLKKVEITSAERRHNILLQS